MRGIPASPLRPAGTGTWRTWPPTRRPGSSPMEKLTKAAGQENSDPAVAEEFLAAEAVLGPRPGNCRLQAAALAGAAAGSAPPGTATRPTAPGTCAARSATPGTRR